MLKETLLIILKQTPSGPRQLAWRLNVDLAIIGQALAELANEGLIEQVKAKNNWQLWRAKKEMAQIIFDRLPAGVVLTDALRHEIAQGYIEDIKHDSKAALYQRAYRAERKAAELAKELEATRAALRAAGVDQ